MALGTLSGVGFPPQEKFAKIYYKHQAWKAKLQGWRLLIFIHTNPTYGGLDIYKEFRLDVVTM